LIKERKFVCLDMGGGGGTGEGIIKTAAGKNCFNGKDPFLACGPMADGVGGNTKTKPHFNKRWRAR